MRIWILIGVALWAVPLGFPKQKTCPFCDPIVIERQQFYEDDYIRGLEDSKPLVQGHRLIVPKRHVHRFEDLSDAELLAVKKLLQKIRPKRYWIVQKNDMMQSVWHLHFHVLPPPKSALELVKNLIGKNL